MKTKSNWIDSLIGYVSPESALKRKTSRSALEILGKFGSYRGAKKTRHTEDWVTKNSSANTDLLYELEDLRARSRDLVRNSPYGAKAVRSIACTVIGTGITPRIKGDKDSKVEALWRKFAEQCDFDGHTDFYGLQVLAARTKVESGEVLVIKRPALSSSNLEIPFQIQILEPDFLDGSKNEDELPNGGYIIQGVEFDKNGRRVAYWIFPKHPGDMGIRKQSERISAASVLHIFEKLRPGQVRGVPAFAPVLLKMKELEDYEEAELVSKRLQACFSAFITRVGNDAFSQTSADEVANEKVEKFRPATVNYLNPGEDIKFGSPALSEGYPEYVSTQLHAIASGLGLTYEQMTGDLSRVNYSSYRAGQTDFKTYNEHQRWHLWIPAFCKPIWNEFEKYAEVKAEINSSEYLVEWTPPRYESIDPIKDNNAAKIAMRSGLMSPQEAIAEMGYDPIRVLDEIAEFNAEADARGVILDSDPRKLSNAGLTQARSQGAELPQGWGEEG